MLDKCCKFLYQSCCKRTSRCNPNCNFKQDDRASYLLWTKIEFSLDSANQTRTASCVILAIILLTLDLPKYLNFTLKQQQQQQQHKQPPTNTISCSHNYCSRIYFPVRKPFLGVRTLGI